MTIKEYQKETKTTARYPSSRSLEYTILGLCREAGEVADVTRRILRDYEGKLTKNMQEKLGDKIGDVMWYVSQVCNEANLDLEEVMIRNIKKINEFGDRIKEY